MPPTTRQRDPCRQRRPRAPRPSGLAGSERARSWAAPDRSPALRSWRSQPIQEQTATSVASSGQLLGAPVGAECKVDRDAGRHDGGADERTRQVNAADRDDLSSTASEDAPEHPRVYPDEEERNEWIPGDPKGSERRRSPQAKYENATDCQRRKGDER